MIFSCFKKLMSRLKILRHGPPNGGPCFWSLGGNKSRGVGIVCNASLAFEDLEIKRDFHGHLINVKLSRHDWKFRSCGFMLLMTLRADRSSFLTCGDTRSLEYLCFWEVISTVLKV